MNCPKVAQDLYWKKLNIPIGVEYSEPYYLAQVPPSMGNNEVSYIDNRQWTNVRGYGNILVYREMPNYPNVNFTVSPWNV
jgi:hypothetical protein